MPLRLRVILLPLLLALAACTTETRTVSSPTRDWMHRLNGDHPQLQGDVAPARAATPESSEGNGYTILLHTFADNPSSNPNNEFPLHDAERMVREILNKTSLTGVWIYPAGSKVQVHQGRFNSPNDPDALNDLRLTRATRLGSEYPFANAQIIAYGSIATTLSGPADLRQFAGSETYTFTLQVAFFDPAGGPQFREAAEIYCQQLRSKGEEAYFFHGPHRSLVTVGLFSDSDVDKDGSYGPKIRDLQKRFPYNLGNGATVITTVNGQSNHQPQPSGLVHLPRD